MNDTAKSFYKFKDDKWGKPQCYKNLKLYPICIQDEDEYELFSQLLCHNKNVIADRDVIKMSYLKFIIYILSASWQMDTGKLLIQLLEYITREKVEINYETHDGVYSIESYSDFRLVLKIGDELIYENDFDNIREMILYQNGLSIEYVNQFDPSLEESLRFIHRKSSDLTLEEQLFSMVADAGQPIDKFSHYTFYQFQKHFGRLSLNIEYKTFKPLEVSGQISFKNGETIDHWLEHKPLRGRYDDILVKKESFTGQSDLFQVAQTK